MIDQAEKKDIRLDVQNAKLGVTTVFIPAVRKAAEQDDQTHQHEEQNDGQIDSR